MYRSSRHRCRDCMSNHQLVFSDPEVLQLEVTVVKLSLYTKYNLRHIYRNKLNRFLLRPSENMRSIVENKRKVQKERKKNAPPVLPRQPPRSLTYPPQAENSTHQWIRNLLKIVSPQYTCEQSESVLFARLPAEIRQFIWTEFLGGHLLHIVRAPKRLLAITCTENNSPDLETRRHGCWGVTNWSPWTYPIHGIYCGARPSHPAKPASLLSLLKSCRRIYTETI